MPSGPRPQVLRFPSGGSGYDTAEYDTDDIDMALNSIADLYLLEKDQILPLDRMANKSVSNLIDGIEKSKEKPFAKVLFGLGIRFVGETVAKKLSKQFKSIRALKKATVEQLTDTNDIGERIAKSLVDYFANPKNQLLI